MLLANDLSQLREQCRRVGAIDRAPLLVRELYFDAVSAQPLGLVEGLVGAGDRRLKWQILSCVQQGDAHAEAHLAAGPMVRGFAEERTQLFGQTGCGLRSDLGQ